LAFSLGLFAIHLVAAAADELKETSSSPSAAAEITPENAREKVLAWIDDYRKDQVLFHDSDIARLRADLAKDTPQEAMRWWQETAEMRAALKSPQWQETSKWLREFLRVQAIFSDEEIDGFRTEAQQAAKSGNPQQLKDVLASVESYRAGLVQSSADDRALRQHKLKVLEAFRKNESAQRSEAAKAAAFGTTSPPAPTVRSRPPRYPSAPLINSLDVARWSVMRNFWRF
jgi:hypothetical protein